MGKEENSCILVFVEAVEHQELVLAHSAAESTHCHHRKNGNLRVQKALCDVRQMTKTTYSIPECISILDCNETCLSARAILLCN